MPSPPWKKTRPGPGPGLSRFVSGLRSDRAGSLVVQTGFPTSLADLVVKNHSRLKKPSRSKKKAPRVLDADPAPAPAPTVGSSSDAADPRSTSPPSSEEASDAILREAEANPRIPQSDRGTLRIELVVLATLVVLILLAIGRKKLVVGITLSAFALCLFDAAKLRIVRFLRPCPQARRSLNSMIGGLSLEGRGWVSPIREAAIDARSDSMGSSESGLDSMGSEKSSVDSVPPDEKTELSMERMDIVGVDSSTSKAKKLLKKFVSKKFRKYRKSKNEKETPLDPSGSSELDSIRKSNQEKEAIMEKEEVVGNGDDGSLCFDSSGDLTRLDAEEKKVESDIEDPHESGTEARVSQLLVFFILVLLGLVGGKVAALVLTMFSILSIRSIEALWNKWNLWRTDSVFQCTAD
ncbi:uncharacterized protein LOC109712313 [Ananas comosus]|uniref:Uncharacterized protein LOC109712313 n=1 Tax=Ananas comosus TaxID=4615 RepID=A0A6P5FDA1_ANACO|nr:uncharacterized protein LOC109712313 [Ananas comosus]